MGAPRGRRPAGSARPRYRRIVAALSAVATTLVTILGALGWLPSSSERLPRPVAANTRAQADVSPAPASPVGAMALSGVVTAPRRDKTRAPGPDSSAADSPVLDSPAVPAGSGTGRRIVFDQSAQRVWLVDASGSGDERVRRTYLVSGSLTDNLHPGTYEVQSRERHAWGIDDSGTMEYFVSFTHGKHAAIGFHDLPIKDGRKLQTRAQLGTPQSHGCIRQWRPDAKALWRFAPVGTAVVVVA